MVVKGCLECLLDLQVLRTQRKGITRKRDSLICTYDLRPGFPVSHYRKVLVRTGKNFSWTTDFVVVTIISLEKNGRKLLEELRREGD